MVQARLRGLLSSKTATDVTEAISVVVELRLRGGAVAGWGWKDDFWTGIDVYSIKVEVCKDKCVYSYTARP